MEHAQYGSVSRLLNAACTAVVAGAGLVMTCAADAPPGATAPIFPAPAAKNESAVKSAPAAKAANEDAAPAPEGVRLAVAGGWAAVGYIGGAPAFLALNGGAELYGDTAPGTEKPTPEALEYSNPGEVIGVYDLKPDCRMAVKGWMTTRLQATLQAQMQRPSQVSPEGRAGSEQTKAGATGPQPVAYRPVSLRADSTRPTVQGQAAPGQLLGGACEPVDSQ